jgi:hypothetical protein
MPAIPNGDEYLMPLNMQRVDQVAKARPDGPTPAALKREAEIEALAIARAANRHGEDLDELAEWLARYLSMRPHTLAARLDITEDQARVWLASALDRAFSLSDATELVDALDTWVDDRLTDWEVLTV